MPTGGTRPLAGLAAELPGIRTWAADLASLARVRWLAAQVAGAVPQLDVLVNNAAAGFGASRRAPGNQPGRARLRMAVNYLAPVLLTRGLLPLLANAAPSQVVQVGSVGQAGFDVADIEFERGYDGVEAYRRAKLALVTNTFDIAAEVAADGVRVNCVHPAGFMDTAMIRESQVRPLSTVADGGGAVLRLITDPAMAALNGEFLSGTTVSTAMPRAYDPEFRRALRDVTVRMLA